MDNKVELELPVFDDSQSEICLAEINANDTIKELYKEMVTCIKDKKYDEAKINHDKIISCNSSLSNSKLLRTWGVFLNYNFDRHYLGEDSFMHIKNYIPSFILGTEGILSKKKDYEKITYHLDEFLKRNRKNTNVAIAAPIDNYFPSPMNFAHISGLNNNLNPFERRHTVDDLTKLESKIENLFPKYFEKEDKEGQELLSKIKTKISDTKKQIPHKTGNSFDYNNIFSNSDLPSDDMQATEEVQNIVKSIAKEAVEKETKEAKTSIQEATITFEEKLGKIGHFDFFMRMAGEGIDTIEKIESESYEDKEKRSRNYIPNNFSSLESLYGNSLMCFVIILALFNIVLLFVSINNEIKNLYFFMASFNAILWFVIYKFNALYSEARRAKHVLQEKMMLLSVVEDEKFKENNDLKAIIYTNVFERDFYIPRKTPENNTDVSTILNIIKANAKRPND